MSQFPTVSIAIPTYNEAIHIEKIVRCFLQTQYSNLIEILITDGGSNDGTQEIVNNLSLEDSRVKLLANPFKIQSAGLNIALEKSQGEIFLRADAHCDYAVDYVEKCVEALQTSKADNVGGAQRFVAQRNFQAAIALASHSWFGSGGAKYRDPNYTGYADTVYLGCFWRKALLEVEQTVSDLTTLNVFDTSQITNQDAELNQKLLDKNPQAIYISSEIKVWYYPRKTWSSLWKQYFKYGRGRYLTTIKHPDRPQLRGKLPFLFVSSLLLFLIFDLFFASIDLYIQELCSFGLGLAFIESLRVNWKLQNNFNSQIWRGKESLPSWLSRWLGCAVVIITMPLAHFSGYGYQIFRYRILQTKGW
jgi:glycosyltransferase involved in cell wall biosynthesis